MKIKAPDLIKMFFEQIKEKYPEVTFNQFRDACNFPFKFTKLHIKDGNFPKIRLKYFGVFSVKKERALWGNYFNEQLHNENRVEEEVYLKRKQNLDKYFERYERTKRKSSIKSRNQ